MKSDMAISVVQRLVSVCAFVVAANGVCAADWWVNHETGSDGGPGTESRPFRTFRHALSRLRGGDTLHLQLTSTPYAEAFGAIDWKKAGKNFDGTPEKPTVVDGHGATLDRLVRAEDDAWRQVDGDTWMIRPSHNVVVMGGAGHYNAFPFVFLGTGEGRKPFQPVADKTKLRPMEMYWCFKWMKDSDGKPVRHEDFGNLYLRLPEGLSPRNCDILIPQNGNMVIGADNVLVRNLNFRWSTADCIDTHRGRNIVFENISATDCLDQNISAHSTARQEVRHSSFARALAGCVFDVPLEPDAPSEIRYLGCIADEGAIAFLGNAVSCYCVESCVVRDAKRSSVSAKGAGRLLVRNCLMAGTKAGDRRGSALGAEGAVTLKAEKCTALNLLTALEYCAGDGSVEIVDCDFRDCTVAASICGLDGGRKLKARQVVFRNCRFASGAGGMLNGRRIGLAELERLGVRFEGCVFGGVQPKGAGSALDGAMPVGDWTKERLRKFLENRSRTAG